MRKQSIFLSLLVLAAGAGAIPAFGVSKDLLRIEQQLDNLQQSVEAMQKTLDTQTASLKTLLELQNQQIERMSAAIAEIQRANQQNLATNSNKIDGMTSQIQALGESLEEAKARIAKLSDQIAQTQNIIQTLRAPSPVAQPGTEGTEAQPANTPAPDPDTLYQSAYGAYMGGQYQIAMQAFQQYLQYYSTSDRASNAQFYVGECYYLQGDYAQAIQAYNRCIEQYPDGNKVAAAQLKKGLAYVALGQTTNGAKELRSLIQRYPNSPEAKIARQKLQKLGTPAPRHR